MRVTELAKLAGVAPYVVRYYSQIGLLAPSRDPANGYRDYTTSDVNRVRFIRRAKLLGFKLSDIRLILGDADHGRSPCPEVRRIIQERATENREHVQAMVALQSRIELAVDAWDELPGKDPSHSCLCHLIDAVAVFSDAVDS